MQGETIVILNLQAANANLPISLKPILLPFNLFPDIYSEWTFAGTGVDKL